MAQYNLLVLAPNKNPAALANKITELAVRLNVSEEQIRLLRAENQRLKQVEVAHEKLKSEHQQTVERKVLLEEEVRWLKAREYPDFCVLSHTLSQEAEYGHQERDFGRVIEG